jgi:hypothetical protein
VIHDELLNDDEYNDRAISALTLLRYNAIIIQLPISVVTSYNDMVWTYRIIFFKLFELF